MSAKHLQLATQLIKGFGSKNQFGAIASAGKARAISADEGFVKVEFEVEQNMANHFGTLHGGCTATLVDIYTTLALLCTKSQRPGVSVDLHVTYLSAAKIGETLIMDSRVTKQGKTLAFTKSELYRKSDNVMIATGVHTKAFPQSTKLADDHKDAFLSK